MELVAQIIAADKDNMHKHKYYLHWHVVTQTSCTTLSVFKQSPLFQMVFFHWCYECKRNHLWKTIAPTVEAVAKQRHVNTVRKQSRACIQLVLLWWIDYPVAFAKPFHFINVPFDYLHCIAAKWQPFFLPCANICTVPNAMLRDVACLRNKEIMSVVHKRALNTAHWWRHQCTRPISADRAAWLETRPSQQHMCNGYAAVTWPLSTLWTGHGASILYVLSLLLGGSTSPQRGKA